MDSSARSTSGDFGHVFNEVVLEVAPDEQAVADEYRSMDHDVVLRRLRGKNAGDGLGFGLPELLPLLSPALFIALDQALRKVVDLSVEGGVKGLARRFRRGRGSSPSSPAIPALSDEQVSDVVARVRESLEQDGVPEGQARDVATALARALPRSPRPEDSGRREVDHVVDD